MGEDTLEKELMEKNKMIRKEKTEKKRSSILNVLRILTILLYLLMNIAIIYMVLPGIQYFSITDKNTIRALFQMGLITFLVPGVFIAFLFIKKSNTVIKIIKGVIQVLLLILLPYVYLVGGLASMAIPSATTNLSNYRIWEERIDEKLEEAEFDMLPTTLPNRIEDVDYQYRYAVIFSDKCLTIELSYSYQDDMDYEKEKNRMQEFNPIYNQKVEDGFEMFYAIDESLDEDQKFRFGYNDADKRVTYRITYFWV